MEPHRISASRRCRHARPAIRRDHSDRRSDPVRGPVARALLAAQHDARGVYISLAVFISCAGLPSIRSHTGDVNPHTIPHKRR